MWEPQPAARPAKGWWTELADRELVGWAEGVAADRERAERVERCQQLAHKIRMAAGGALSRDRWDRIQRRRDERSAIRLPGGLVADSWGAGHGEVEHSAHVGRVLGVR